MRILAAIAGVLIAAGCVSTPNVWDLPRASADELIGTWTDMRTIETFLADGTYCSSSASGGAFTAVGTWHMDEPGWVSVNISRSPDPRDVAPDEPSEMRVLRVPKADRLLMGAECFHCMQPIAGSVYRRTMPARVSCSVPGGFAIPAQ